MFCAQPTLDRDDVCAYHLPGHGDDWAIGNRIMCDFLHRGIVPPAPSERSDALELLVEALDQAVSAGIHHAFVIHGQMWRPGLPEHLQLAEHFRSGI